MQDNPFLSALKIAFTGALAFLVFLAFWQRTHLEEQVAQLATANSALTDRVGDMARKVDDLKSKADRLDGAASTIAQIVKDHLGRGDAAAPSAAAPVAAPTPGNAEWGWALNAGLDARLDPTRPVGTPGRYPNALELDPDPEYPAEAAAHDGGTLATPYSDDPKGWNLLTENAAELQEIMEQYCAESPANGHFANPYKLSPALCWRIEIDPTSREFTLFFRRDVVWHPVLVDLDRYPHLRGTHSVTANDYKFTLDMVMNPQVDCAPLRAYFDHLESVKTYGDWVCVVKFNKTYFHTKDFTVGRAVLPEFLFAYDEKGVRFPAETIGQQFNDHYYNRIGVCGCGPYRMVSYQEGQWITLERFDDWYGMRDGRRYPVKTKKLLIYKDPETTLLKLQSGELDMTGLTSSQYKKKVLTETDPTSPFKDGRIEPYKTPRPAYRYIGWKNTNPLFTDARVRKALALASDRADMCHKIFIDKWIPMAVPVWPQSPQYDSELKVLPYDPAEAARLLDAAGWKLDADSGLRMKDGRKFEFKLTFTSGNPDSNTYLNQFKNELRSIGVKMELDMIEWNLFQKKLDSRDFEAVLGGWATNSWDHDFDQIWSSKQIAKPKSSNFIEYSNPELDQLSEDLRTEMDVTKRKEKVMRISRILYDDQPVTFIAWDSVFGAHWKHVKNVNGHLHKIRPFQRTYSLWIDR